MINAHLNSMEAILIIHVIHVLNNVVNVLQKQSVQDVKLTFYKMEINAIVIQDG